MENKKEYWEFESISGSLYENELKNNNIEFHYSDNGLKFNIKLSSIDELKKALNYPREMFKVDEINNKIILIDDEKEDSAEFKKYYYAKMQKFVFCSNSGCLYLQKLKNFKVFIEDDYIVIYIKNDKERVQLINHLHNTIGHEIKISDNTIRILDN